MTPPWLSCSRSFLSGILNECNNNSLVSVEGLSHVSVKAKISNSKSSALSISNFDKMLFVHYSAQRISYVLDQEN